MPTGKVRFYDATKGFGFLTKDGTSTLPPCPQG